MIVYVYKQNLSINIVLRLVQFILNTSNTCTFQSGSTLVRIKFSTKLVHFVQSFFCITNRIKKKFHLVSTIISTK